MRICRKCNSLREDDMIFCPECGVKYVTYDNQVYAAPECPVVIVEQNLILEDGNVSGAVVFGNIGEKRIAACAVRIRCSDQFGDALSDVIVKYNDLLVDKDETFGDEKIFSITDPDTRRIQIVPEKILFDDGSMQSCEDVVFSRTDAHNSFMKAIEAAFKEEETIKNQLRFQEIYLELHLADSIEQRSSIIAAVPDFVIPDIGLFPFDVFSGTPLRSIVVPSSVKDLEKSCFENCKELECVELSEGLKRIHDLAFSNCKKLKKIVIPDTVEEIAYDAFSLSGLKEIHLSERMINKVFHEYNNEFLFCNAQMINSTARKRRQKEMQKQANILYWSTHAEEKQQLESERDTLQAEIKQLQAQRIPHEREISDWKRKREADTPAQDELRNVEKQISSLKQKYSQLGIFKGKEKKALQAQIDELYGRIPAIDQSIEAEKKEQTRLCNAKIREIEETAKPIKDQITAVQTRINEINTELTRDR